MLAVCEQCFGGDWQAMLGFARRYNPEKQDREVQLGKRFREIIGTRNRTKFWHAVAVCGDVAASEEVIVDGDSLQEMQRAFRLCADGTTVTIQIDGKIIGRLIPGSQLS
jgi:hypothetical protein